MADWCGCVVKGHSGGGDDGGVPLNGPCSEMLCFLTTTIFQGHRND
ncbi:hypothetical protein E2C01_091507 [Portunus trituberculatus]|uniref:Uncharacterized protein n=1 Tax=Portunus trituberculatus TaxID=210409 RepID=A0A5B7JN46_PORTR|nr:hypothetical protein [Portunus trituberculatus]